MANCYASFVGEFDLETIRDALNALGRKGGAFAPSGPEVFAQCEKMERDPVDLRDAPLMLGRPPIMLEARERIKQGFNDLLAELKEGGKQPRVAGWTSLGDALQPALRDWTTASGQLSSQSLDWPRKIGLQTETGGVEPPK
jgi:hypothetical protein